MKNSHIEWTDHTFNPWIGCTKVSPGCAHCYAEAMNIRWHKGANWGAGAPRVRTSKSYWQQPLKWNEEAAYRFMDWNSETNLGKDLGEYQRPRVFCASLADWLDDEVPIEWLIDLLALIDATPNLDWLLLTKRPENFIGRITAATHGKLSPFEVFRKMPNIWVGTSVENQEMADKRIPELLSIPARVRFHSCEPLLGPLNLVANVIQRGAHYKTLTSKDWLEHIHWVICGGESGPNARPMHPDWARNLRDQCSAAGVPFFFKQWGQQVRGDQITFDGIQDEEVVDNDRFYTITSKSDFRELDGRQWNELPS
jgi:protein gp37